VGHPGIPGPGQAVHPGTRARLGKANPGRQGILATRRLGTLDTPASASMVPLVTPGILARPGLLVAMEIQVTLGTPAIRRPGTLDTPASVPLVTPGIPAMLRPAIRGILVRPVPQAAMEIQATLGTPALRLPVTLDILVRLVAMGVPGIPVIPATRLPGTLDTPASMVHLVTPGIQVRPVPLVEMEIPDIPGIPALLRPAIRGFQVRQDPQVIPGTLATQAILRLVRPAIPGLVPLVRPGIPGLVPLVRPGIPVILRLATLVTHRSRGFPVTQGSPGRSPARVARPGTPPTLVHLAPLVSLGAEAEVPRRRCTCCLPDSPVRDTRRHPQTNRAAPS